MTALLLTLVLLVLILARVPVSFAILGTGILGLLVLADTRELVGILETAAPTSVMSYTLSAAPLFILMAHLILLSGLADHLFDAARVVVGRLRGGTAVASITAGTAFAAVSGSSTASAATLAHTSTVRMIDEGYRPRLAGGLIAVVGTLAAMIPPSVILVFYAITAEVSVGDMIIAAVFPGLLIAAGLMLTLFAVLALDPEYAPGGVRSPLRDKVRAFVPALPIILLFGAVVGSIYTGVATPTEAAGLGAVVAFLLVLVRGRASKDGFARALVGTVKTSAMIFVIIVGAHVFGHFLTETRVTPSLVAWIDGLPLEPFAVMLLIGLVYLVLGFFMDQIAIIALTVPVVLPVVLELGYDPVWFGIFIVLLAEVGLVTPPMGLNVFVVARSASRPVGEVFRGAVPFAATMVGIALVLLIWPEIVLWAV